MDQRRFRWRPTGTQVLWASIIVVGLLVAITVSGYVFEWKWTGLVKDEDFPNRTLWDWLELLVVPAVLAVGVAWFNQQHQDNQDKRDEERTHHEVLQGYLDQMGTLLLEKKLTTAPENSDVRKLAQSRTLTALDATGPIQQARILRFLHELNLIQSRASNKPPIISLQFASLPGIDLHRRRVLESANLTGARLTNADIRGAHLTNADLTNAELTQEQLAACKSLKGATMLNGQKYEQWLGTSDGQDWLRKYKKGLGKYKKALFVKPTWRPLRGRTRRLYALRTMLPSALSVSSLSVVAQCTMRSVLSVKLRRCDLPSGLSFSGEPSPQLRSRLDWRSEALCRASLGLYHFTLGVLPYRDLISSPCV